MQKHNRQVVRKNTMNLYPEQKKFHAGFQVNSHRQIIFKILKPKTTKGSKGVCCFCLEPSHKALSLDFLLPLFPSLYFMISLHSVFPSHFCFKFSIERGVIKRRMHDLNQILGYPKMQNTSLYLFHVDCIRCIFTQGSR